MSDPKPERRSGQRVPVRVPVAISAPDTNLQATGRTRDLSSNGIFFYTDSPIQKGNDVEMVMILPPELTSGEKRWVCCHATVVRVENNKDGSERGVAATVQKMEFLPEIGR